MATPLQFLTKGIDIRLRATLGDGGIECTIGAFAMAIRDMDVEHGDD